MQTKYMSVLLVTALAAGSFEAYTHQDHTLEDFYPTTEIVQVDRPYITGSYVQIPTGSYVQFPKFDWDYGSTVPSGSCFV